MFEVIAVVLEDVEAFVLDFPSRPGASGDFGDGLAGDGGRSDAGALVGCFALGVGDGQADPVDGQGVLALAQRGPGEPGVAGGPRLGALLCADGEVGGGCGV